MSTTLRYNRIHYGAVLYWYLPPSGPVLYTSCLICPFGGFKHSLIPVRVKAGVSESDGAVSASPLFLSTDGAEVYD